MNKESRRAHTHTKLLLLQYAAAQYGTRRNEKEEEGRRGREEPKAKVI